MRSLASTPSPTQDHDSERRAYSDLTDCVFAFAFAAFLRLLCIMTMLKKLPTTAPPNRSSMTGMRIAQTRGGKSDCKGWESSTKGCREVVLAPRPAENTVTDGGGSQEEASRLCSRGRRRRRR